MDFYDVLKSVYDETDDKLKSLNKQREIVKKNFDEEQRRDGIVEPLTLLVDDSDSTMYYSVFLNEECEFCVFGARYSNDESRFYSCGDFLFKGFVAKRLWPEFREIDTITNTLGKTVHLNISENQSELIIRLLHKRYRRYLEFLEFKKTDKYKQLVKEGIELRVDGKFSGIESRDMLGDFMNYRREFELKPAIHMETADAVVIDEMRKMKSKLNEMVSYINGILGDNDDRLQ